jgi:hypothetical protein
MPRMNPLPFVALAGLGTSAILLGQFSATAGSRSGDDGGTAAIGADVIVGAITPPVKYGSASVNGVTMMAYAIGTVSCNIGDAQLQWYASPDTRHPFIPMNAYRYFGGRFEQIGMSWGKHGFCALQQSLCGTCQPVPGGCPSLLGVGCSDPYDASLNGDQGGLGPRHEVNAATGAFPGTYGSGMPNASPTVGRRLQIASGDLNPATSGGAIYYFEAQYVHPQDAAAGNKHNNASHVRFNVGALTSGAYTLTLNGSTVLQKPAIESWRAWDANVQSRNVDVPNDGRFIVAESVRSIGAAGWRYEYAIFNLNSDRSARSFSVPVGVGANVANIGFKDIDYHSGEPFSPTDWTGTFANGTVTWTGGDYAANPNSNALRFATLYNFWFDSDQPPASATGTLGLFKPGPAGAPTEMTMATRGPAAAGNPSDLNGDGFVGADDLSMLLGNWGNPGVGDLNGDGIVGAGDLSTMLSSWN